MAVLEQTKSIPLSKPLELANVRYEQIDLKEPVLSEVEQFYELQRSKNGMAAMKLLIALNSGLTEKVLGGLAYTDYRKCEDYLMGFLTFNPSETGKD
ncbi:phage tail assembly protein [Erwinia sp. S38]|uniref:phage tail assembly protein n=1 Tax=Erwinia sp. S38 TaxID=2769338 RepID=UPI001909F169|nr:phage tail assembly protein [Erwinia sp. S38]MBK0004381.1 phage tail assembly protein [Erwinia sp. S38]